MSKNYRSIIISAIVVGFLLVIGSGWSWWHLVYSSPKNTFQRMINSSLSSSSATKVEKNDSGEVEESKKSIQRNTPNAVVETKTSSSKKGTDLAVTEESVAGLHEEYSAYTVLNIENQDGQKVDYSNVVGVWSRVDDETAKDDVQSVAGSIFNVVPIVQLTKSDRQEIISYINENNVYTVDYSSVKRMNVDGRPRYTYAVEMNTYEYVSMLKKLASKLDIHQFDNVNADDYRDPKSVAFSFDVDVWSGQLISFNTADGSSRQEYYSYGIQTPIDFPKNYISKDELQTKINSKQ